MSTDLLKKNKDGGVSLPAPGGKRTVVNIIWTVPHLNAVQQYASARGISFNALANEILLEHVAKVAKKRRWKNTSDTKATLKKLAGEKMRLTEYIRMTILKYLDENPLKSPPPAPPEQHLPALKSLRPDALVYTVPISGAKIIVSKREEGGWKGLAMQPEVAGSTFAWNSQNFNPPSWARSPYVVKALVFISSRVDDDDMSYFSIPKSNIKISAYWDPKTRRFEKGEIIEPAKQRHQPWVRSGWYSQMDAGGPFNYLSNVRRLQNMLCRAITTGDNGLNANPPLH